MSVERSSNWRDDEGWRLVEVDFDYWGTNPLPPKPTANAELAQPPVWASLYDDRRIVATWWRPRSTSPPPATMVAEDE